MATRGPWQRVRLWRRRSATRKLTMTGFT